MTRPDSDLARKDAAPADTIERILTLLDGLGFPRGRPLVDRWSASPDCHSCHLRFENLPLIFANGKGVTSELAYASALAEFIERLECRVDALFTAAGNIHELAPFSSPSPCAARDLLSACPRLCASDLCHATRQADRVLPCVPFLDVFGRRVVELPFDLLYAMTGSSGMCAGNTVEEALAHGICEIFERHVVHALDSGRVAGLPTLPHDTLPIGTPVLRRQVESLAASGIELLVKDATLGGAFPVLAVVLTDREAGTSHVSFGADPVFDNALSRCLTEAFQGASRLFRRLPREGWAPPRDTYNNLEVLRERLLPNAGRPSAAAAFVDLSTNDEALRFAVERVKRSGHDLYVRDFSLFGFPAYYVYVDGLSALRELRPADVAGPGVRAHVRTTLFRLRHASAAEVASCADVLFDEVSGGDPIPDGHFVRELLRAPVGACIGLHPLLTLMLLELGAVGKAREVQALRPIASEDLVRRPTPHSAGRWFMPYVEARGKAVAADTLRARFEEAFGQAPERIADGGAAADSGLLLPRCDSVYSCPSCPCRRYCRLDGWYRIAGRLRSRAVPVSQQALAERLATRPASRA